MSTFSRATTTGSINSTNTLFTYTTLATETLNFYLNGELLNQGVDFTSTSGTLTLSQTPQTGDTIQLWQFKG